MTSRWNADRQIGFQRNGNSVWLPNVASFQEPSSRERPPRGFFSNQWRRPQRNQSAGTVGGSLGRGQTSSPGHFLDLVWSEDNWTWRKWNKKGLASVTFLDLSLLSRKDDAAHDSIKRHLWRVLIGKEGSLLKPLWDPLNNAHWEEAWSRVNNSSFDAGPRGWLGWSMMMIQWWLCWWWRWWLCLPVSDDGSGHVCIRALDQNWWFIHRRYPRPGALAILRPYSTNFQFAPPKIWIFLDGANTVGLSECQKHLSRPSLFERMEMNRILGGGQ